MVKTENFIYFITACGFFIGLIYSVLFYTDPIFIVWGTITVTIIFYVISLAASGFFIKSSTLKPSYSLKSDSYDVQLSKAMMQIERREKFLRDTRRYIEDLEQELYSKSQDLDDMDKDLV